MLATFYVSTGVVILWVYVCAKLPDASSRSVEFVLREMNCDWFKPFTKITSNYHTCTHTALCCFFPSMKIPCIIQQ